MISFICHSDDRDRADHVLLASLRAECPTLWTRTDLACDLPNLDGPELLLMSGLPSLAEGYAAAERHAAHPVCVYCHDDAVLPFGWVDHFTRALAEVERRDPAWGVVGVFGTYWDQGRQAYVGNVRDNGAYRVEHLADCPRRVEAVDCFVFCKRRDPRLRWDPEIPGFLGGAVEDICLQAHAAGLGVWAVNVYTEHRDHQKPHQTMPDYLAARRYVMAKWPQRPILTTAQVWTD